MRQLLSWLHLQALTQLLPCRLSAPKLLSGMQQKLHMISNPSPQISMLTNIHCWNWELSLRVDTRCMQCMVMHLFVPIIKVMQQADRSFSPDTAKSGCRLLQQRVRQLMPRRRQVKKQRSAVAAAWPWLARLHCLMVLPLSMWYLLLMAPVDIQPIQYGDGTS